MKLILCLAAAAMLSATALADGPVRHVVHFKFKKDATPEQKQAFEKSQAAHNHKH